MLLAPAVVMRIDVARVWLNDELVFEFVCDDSSDVCHPGERKVGIPPLLLMEDPNRIEILVEGSQYAVLEFAIRRASGWPNGD
jgi:hypothetical protein